MIRMKRTTSRILIFALAVVILVAYLRNNSNYMELQFNYKEFKSSCECRANEKIKVKEYDHKSYEITSDLVDLRYRVDKNLFGNTTCDMFNVLRRGLQQKVLGYSLYGKKTKYSSLLKEISKSAKKKYPGWIVRVHHDSSIEKETKCEIECLKDESGAFVDNVDFCNVEHMPPNKNAPDKFLLKENKMSALFYDSPDVQPWNASYVHGMMWRWFPIGDHFVDAWLSRDSDSSIFQREVDAVEAWLKSNKVVHIMRDNPQHGTYILGGMWGYNNTRDRELGDQTFNEIIKESTSQKYNPRRNHAKHGDQLFLGQYLYKKVKDKSLVHDSYLCRMYKDSVPFPTKMVGACFVGLPWTDGAGCEKKHMGSDCPKTCRPKYHQDWTNC